MWHKITTLAILNLLLITTSVVAQSNTPILPNHPIYPLKILFEKIQLFLTANPEAKVRLHMSLAEKRTAELDAIIGKGKLQYVERLKQNYEHEINEGMKILKKHEGLGRNVTNIAEHIASKTYKHIVVLERVMEKVPDVAKPSIEHAINVSLTGHAISVIRIEEKIEEELEEVETFACNVNSDCMHQDIICPMVVGSDTPVCDSGRCKCGGRWEIPVGEWVERFHEPITDTVQERNDMMKEIHERISHG